MRLVRRAAFLVCFLTVTGGLSAQDAAKKPDTKEPAAAEAAAGQKGKGPLPSNWAKLGLTDEQRTRVYKIQGKYGDQIDKLEAQIKELKEKMAKERLEVLTPEQKKRLADIAVGAAGGGGGDK